MTTSEYPLLYVFAFLFPAHAKIYLDNAASIQSDFGLHFLFPTANAVVGLLFDFAPSLVPYHDLVGVHLSILS